MIMSLIVCRTISDMWENKSMNKMTIKTKFGLVVKKKRIELNLSQEKFAEMIGLHRTYISEVESGTRNVSLINIEKIAKGLNTSVSEIFREMGE